MMRTTPQPTANSTIHRNVTGHEARIPIRPSSPIRNSHKFSHASADTLPPRVDLDRPTPLGGVLQRMTSALDCQARMTSLLTVAMVSMNFLKLFIETIPPFLQLTQEGQPHATFVQLCLRHHREGFSLIGLTGTFFFGSNFSFFFPNAMLLLLLGPAYA